MAVPSLYATAPARASLSCGTTIYSGLKLQSATPFGTAKPNAGVDFFSKVHLSLQSGSRNHEPIRGRFKMMSFGTPMVPYKTPGEGTMQWVDIWNALYRERIVYLSQDIDEEYGNQLVATLLYLDTIEDSRRLYVYINITSGEVTPSLAFYDTMLSLKSPVGTLCFSTAQNLAGFILAAGDKGYRNAMPNSFITLENPAGVAYGQADDVANETKELLRIRDYLFQELAKNTGHPVEKIAKDLSHKKLPFTAPRALEYGLIDRIVRPGKLSDVTPP